MSLSSGRFIFILYIIGLNQLFAVLTVLHNILPREAVAEEFVLIIVVRTPPMARCLQEERAATMRVVVASDTAREAAAAAIMEMPLQAEPERPASCTSSGANVRRV